MKDKTRIYYEVYGHGKPLVLLHGGLFGDISEFANLIPVLSKHFKVIAVETRGHGKSEIGHQPFTYQLMAADAFAITRHESNDSAIIIGFSDGAVIGMDLTIVHPEIVKKLVFVGGDLAATSDSPDDIKQIEKITGAYIEKEYPAFVKERKKLMPQPDRWNDFVEKLKYAWLSDKPISSAQLKRVTCQVMIVGGDRDQYTPAKDFVLSYKMLANARLAIIPNSDHLVFKRRPDLMRRIIMPFVLEK